MKFFYTHIMGILTCLYLVVFPNIISAQAPLDWSKHAQKSWEEKDYLGAAYYYDLAYENDSINLAFLWKSAESYRMANEVDQAINKYKILISKDEKVNFEDAVFRLAEMLKMKESYVEAQQYFDFYRDICTDKRSAFYKRAKVEIHACILAQTYQEMPDDVAITLPNYPLNSFDAEFSPVIINDTHLIFSALRYDTLPSKLITSGKTYTSLIYSATYINKEWVITAFDSLINDSLSDNANPCISPDSTQLFFTRCNENGCAIWVSNWHEDHWENAAKLNQNINFESSNSTHPFVTELKNGKTYLLFSSNRPRSRGGMDIWSVEIKANGTKFGRAKNAGRKVNTYADEISPYYDTANSTLFFSSEGQEGFGGFDVFKSVGSPGRFDEPKNLGKPINSSYNDLYYQVDPSTQKGSFVSNRPGGYALKGAACCNDIYLFAPIDTNKIDSNVAPVIPVQENLMVKLEAIDFLPLSLYFDNDQPNPRTTQITSEYTYQETYEAYQRRKPVFFQNAPKKNEIDSFFINDLEVGYQKLQMLADSLIKYVGMGYKLQLGIKGFTSPLGNTEYNDHLALRRISSIENYLYTCKENALKPYIDSGLLKFRQIPFGEFFSLDKVSDDLQKQTHSVYSPSASEARKVEIIWVEQTIPGDSSAIIMFEKTTHNFGKLPLNTAMNHTFKFTNSGERPLEILEVIGNCECLEIVAPESPIAPGESGEITVSFHTQGKTGLQFFGIVVKTNASGKDKQLFLRGVIPPQVETY